MVPLLQDDAAAPARGAELAVGLLGCFIGTLHELLPSLSGLVRYQLGENTYMNILGKDLFGFMVSTYYGVGPGGAEQ